MFDVITIVKVCPFCNGTKEFVLDKDRYQEWQNGQLIQVSFPEMTDDDRERLITGTCPDCWNSLFPEEDDED